ncbi:hypothetical protein SLE2022_278400 [Rubroshorea leprosula]
MIKTYLPEEVVIQILLRLPTASLLRFKCLCKSWYNLIESPQIMAMQLRNKSSLSLLVNSLSPRDNDQVEPGSSVWSLLTYDDRMQLILDGENVSFARQECVDLPSCYENVMFSASNHCDGIICLYDGYNSDGTTIMTNPGIREFMVLPESCIPLPTALYECHGETTFFGFGFDQVTNDYKIVRILEFASLYGSPVANPQAEVYTLSSNSWRQIEFTDCWMRSYESELSTYWNGACYWPAEQCQPQNDWVYGVYSFDFGNEVFQFIIIPEYVSRPFGLYEFNGTLALISFSYHSMENNFEIWVMDELGFNGIWTKLASVEPLPGVEKPLGFLKSDELLLLLSAGMDWDSGRQIASYNIVTKQVKNICHEDCCGAMIYNCSLVSINRRRIN